MKNVRKNQLKKCIFVELEEFEEVVKEAVGNDVEVECDEGLYFETDEDIVSTEKVLEGLSEYYDVEVTSVHADDCDVIGIWVCYKD